MINDAMQEVIDGLGENVSINEKPGKKPTVRKDCMNVIATQDDLPDLVKQGWTHRGVVGGNVYFQQGEITEKDE